MKFLRRLSISLLVYLCWSAPAHSQQWTPLNNQPTFETDTALLLTDGTVMMHEYGFESANAMNWWRLTPDNTGSYVNGTWSQLASLESSYAPLYFASAVLPDGRVLIEGGEDNYNQSETDLGSIYDPLTNVWTNVDPPAGWTEIGDSPAVVLADGTFLLGQNFTTRSALFDAKTLTWTPTNGGKHDSFYEEGFVLLPNGDVLLVDTNFVPDAEKYIPGEKKWVAAGKTPVDLVSDQEIGPMVLRPDGTVFAMGAHYNGSGHTAIYTPAHGKSGESWKKGPNFPNGDDTADAPASILPDGNVLCDTSPSLYKTPVTFYEFDGTKFISAPQLASNSHESSYNGRMLVLPTGQVLYAVADGMTIDVELYTAAGGPKSSWAPTITSAPATVSLGKTYQIFGTQFNGLSQGAAYGDDAQMATNYPLVRITNNNTQHVFYARTHDHSTMGVATGHKKVSTHFDVPSDMETGASELVVVANGIASLPVAVTVQ